MGTSQQPPSRATSAPRIVGRYALYGELASGGMATIHYGRHIGPVGFSRTVAIKRLHAQFAKDTEFVSMFIDEARLAARIRHPNVVPTVDVVALEGELLLVMEYVLGESLAYCLRASSSARRPIPLDVVSAIACGVLHGLHAAHEATNEQGAPLEIVHRDVSPQNVLVGADGVPRVLDFGVAKAAGRVHSTRDGQIKGKLAYMAAEQLRNDGPVDRRTDVYALGVVLWETMTRQRLFAGDNEGIVIRNVLERRVEAPSAVVPDLPSTLDAITLRALDRDPSMRFQTARDMALAMEDAVPLASATRVAEWLDSLAHDRLSGRSSAVAAVERDSERLSLTDAVGVAEEISASARLDTQATRVRELPADVTGASLTQMSSLSMATTRVSSQTTTAPGRARLLVILAASAASAVLLGLFVRIGMSRGSASAAGDSSATTPPATANDPAPPSVPSAADSSSSSAASSSVVATPPSASTATPALRPWRQPGANPAPTAKPCTVKSFIDESGIKHYVKDCK